MAKNLTPADLYTLEKYAQIRDDFRVKIIAHKKPRRVALGTNAALYFEDVLTMQYQIQEMLRIEKIFEQKGIQEELDVYNPLIPDGGNLKATFMLEFPDEQERKKILATLIGIEKTVYIKVAEHPEVYPIVNEDLDRSAPDKTASVHFMRFEFTPDMIADFKRGADVRLGISHPNYQVEISLSDESRRSLVQDFD